MTTRDAVANRVPPAQDAADQPQLAGLSEADAQARRAKGMGNTPPPPTGRTYWQIVRDNVFNSINVIIFLLGIALVLVRRPGDAAVSVLVISTNIVVGLVQEIRAKRTLDKIALLTRPKAIVVRDGQARAASQEELVVGDVLKVMPGDQIVLDGKIIGDGRMTVDESQLTGESDPVPKKAGDPVYSGSFCVAGSGYYVVEKVSRESMANQITASARAHRRVLTPLQTDIDRIVRIILLLVIYLEFMLFLNALLKQIGAPQTIANATLIVGLVPNGLFLSISVAYALGALRILRFGTLVQQSNAIESLSNVTVLCLDKTGTLTTNELRVNAVHPIPSIDVSEDELKHILGTMAASASAGNKTSEAIAAAFPAPKRRLLAEVPFSSARKWSAVALDDGGEGMRRVMRGIYALGAPEMLRPYLGEAGKLSSSFWQGIAQQISDLSDKGLRVLLVTYSPDPTRLEDKGESSRDDSRLPSSMWPIGLVSLSDELRPEARETLEAFAKSGVRLKIISGDNPETVAALAKQAGFGPDIKLVSGLDLEHMDEAQFGIAAKEATVFGRITPQQKERIVRTLRQDGQYVAMIGDGVNDVLSLKQANLGIAMQSGSQATRGVADLVLMKDSFAALAPAVAEGQRIVNGMQDILKLYLTRILTMALLIVSSLMIGQFPFELRNGSIVTLFSVGIPGVMLALWARPGLVQKGTLGQRLTHFVLPPVLLTSIIGLLLFYGILLMPSIVTVGADLTTGRALQATEFARPVAQTALSVFTTLCGIFLVIFAEPPTDWWVGGDQLSGDRRPTFLAILLIIALFIVTAVPLLQRIFALAPLSLLEYGLIATAVAIWIFLVRWFWRRRVLESFLSPHSRDRL